MFESLVANLLNRFLGAYIENFDPKQLNIGIWGGDVKLRNLRLKRDSLDKFKLPVDVKFGHVGELTLQIPWSNLKGKPVKVIIDDVYVLASPKILEDFDLEEEKNREQQLKREKLNNWEALEQATVQNQNLTNDLENNESFTESLVTKIIDNLQVTIKNIHVRYEDDSILTENPYALGFTLSELSAVSTDLSWTPSSITITQALTHKLLVLKSFSCYMSTDSDLIDGEAQEMLERFKSILNITSDVTAKDNQYLLRPISGQGKLTINKRGATEENPQFKTEFFFDEFGVVLDHNQYQNLLWTASKFHYYMKTQRFRKLRPKVTVKEDPLEWFRFAAQTILNEIHDKHYKWTWEHFAKRRDQRKAYIRLWKLHLLKKNLSKEDKEELEQLEYDLPYEDIKLYRSLTRSEIKKENKGISLSALLPKTENKGWFSGWWGGQQQPSKSDPSAPESDPSKMDLQLSEEQRKALYDVIEYDENRLTEAVDVPRERTVMEVIATLRKGGIAVKRDKSSSNLGEIVFEHCKAHVFKRPDSLLTNFQLQEFRVEDGTEGALYKHMVSVKHLHSHESRLERSSEPPSSLASVDDVSKVGWNEPFFKISFENNPLDGSADSALKGHLRSMTIFYNPHFIEEIIRFFKPPKMHLDTVGAIMNAAEATVEGITSQTRIGLQYALEEHKTINVKLDLQAPLIIVPLDPTSFKTPVAILDAGHLSVKSALVDKSNIEEIKSKATYDSKDWEKLKTLMYDEFELHLEDSQFLIGPRFKSALLSLHDDDNSMSILSQFDMRFTLGISIMPSATSIPRFKILAKVPAIKLSMNDFQYKTMMKIIDAAIPNIDSSDISETGEFETFGNVEQDDGLVVDFGSDSDSDSKSPTPTKNANSSSDRSLEQHLFDFDFKVDRVLLSLHRCVDASALQTDPLVDLIGENLHMFFVKTERDMDLSLTLDNINLLDYIENSGVREFDHLITSNRLDGTDVSSKADMKQLFKLNYKRMQRIVEFKGKEIEVFDQDIDLDVATVKFVVLRKSLLSLLNFTLNTFTDPNAEETPADELKHNDATDESIAPERINVKVNLDSIIMVLNEDGIKLATLKLSTAEVSVLVLPEALDVRGKLGALTLHDEINHGSSRDSVLRNLFSIEGDNLAEFKYITYDPTTNNEPYSSYVEFSSGAPNINFIEDAFGRIFNFLSQFQQMKSIYDSAREAAIEQASTIEGANQMKFNVVVRAPTILFPRIVPDGNRGYDRVTARLGEFYAFNEFKEGENGILRNVIDAGIRNIKLDSLFHFDNGVQQLTKIVDDLDLSMKIDYADNLQLREGERPTIIVGGSLPELDLKLTELQLQYLTNLSDSITKVFTPEAADDILQEVEEEADTANAAVREAAKALKPPSTEAAEKKMDTKTENVSKVDDSHLQVKFDFEVPRVSLTIYNRTSGISDISGLELSTFSLNKSRISFESREDTHFTANVNVKSFVVEDVRSEGQNKFREIIPPSSGESDQFELTATSEGTKEKKNVTVILGVDNPKTILALDYIFELQRFATIGMEKNVSIGDMEDAYESSEEDVQLDRRLSVSKKTVTSTQKPEVKHEKDLPDEDTGMKIGYSVNVTNPSIILLADPTSSESEAIVFKVGQVLITSQNVISLAANNIGMFFCHMNDFEKRLRIIDDFSISFALDARGSSGNKFLTNIEASIEPMLLRLSLRDIRLAIQIFNRAVELSQQAHSGQESETDESGYNFSDNFKRRLSQYAPTIMSGLPSDPKKPSQVNKEEGVVVKGEELNASFGGLRFVLIGDVHELPVLDMNVETFEIRAHNWSTDLNAEAHIESFVNIYNYSRSSWEPLVEPWPISVYATKVMDPKPSMTIDVVLRQLAEITVSSRSVALLSQMLSLITDEGQMKSRENDDPYRIRNGTGFDIEVWSSHEPETKKVLKNNDTTSWSFEDWRAIRENLDSDNSRGQLAVKLLGSDYGTIDTIPVTGEGEELYVLTPSKVGYHNRLCADVSLGDDNIKTIWLRSTLKVQNDTDIAIVILLSGKAPGSGDSYVVQANEVQALPIDKIYESEIQIRPQVDVTYNWSDKKISWSQLLERSASLKCSAAQKQDVSTFNFEINAKYDQSEPLAKIYPHLTMVVSAPVEIENLLPYDFTYRIYDKKTKSDWSGLIQKGVKSYVHIVSLANLLMLSVEPIDCGFEKSEFAIINTPAKSEFNREHTISLRHKITGQHLKLRIHYPRKDGKAGIKLQVFSPYVILNKTNQSIRVSERNNIMHSNNSTLETSQPCMFSYDKFGDRQNRALLKIGDSNWTSPLSLDAIGQNNAVTAQIPNKQMGMDVAVSIEEGTGRYILTKVVTIAPRFILKNLLDEDLTFVETGSTKQFTLKKGEMQPLYGLRNVEEKSLSVKFTHNAKGWSSAFAISDIGQMFLKVGKEGVGQILLKVNILTENGTVFIQVENSNNHWPFSIRNFSDCDFYIYQADPNVNDRGEVVKRDTPYKPIYYKVPAKSVMPYAYDYPNAVIKELIIRCRGMERNVNLAEIGNLKPFRLPASQDQEHVIVDLNVVADGPTQSLILSNYDPLVSLYKLKGGTSSTVNVSQNFEANEVDENYHTRIVTRFEGFGISLINTRLQELCYVTLRGLEVRYNESDLYQNLSLKLKWIQVDNQLYGGIFPIVIYPTVVPKSGKEMNNHPSFSASVCKVKDDSHGVLFIKYATTLLQEMTIEIDEDFLFALLDFAKFPGASWNKKIEDKLCDDKLDLPEPASLSESSDVYFEALHLQPALTNLSFMRTERVNAEEKAPSQNTLMFFFNVLTMAIGNINDAPIKLNALFIENIRVPLPILIESIETHYGQAFLYQVHKILGSADFLGNPVGLFKNISSGVLDIFYEPYQGVVINDRPQELGIGIAKGGLSFVKKTVFGFSDSFAKVTGSLAKGLSVVTLDRQFQERRRLNQRRNRPKHALYGFASGANSFFESVSSGVTGFATAPMEGAANSGASGFFKGLGKGVVGLPTKTAIGFFDLASNVSEGIRNTTTVFDTDALDKVRLPRYISVDHVIRPYSQREAQGQFWLKSIDGGSCMNEQYLAHLVLPGEEKCILVTFRFIVLFAINTLKTNWMVHFEDISAITVEATGISIGLKKRNGPFIPIPEKANKSFLYNKIGLAVEKFNKKCQVEL